jgi:hypothetical protein
MGVQTEIVVGGKVDDGMSVKARFRKLPTLQDSQIPEETLLAEAVKLFREESVENSGHYLACLCLKMLFSGKIDGSDGCRDGEATSVVGNGQLQLSGAAIVWDPFHLLLQQTGDLVRHAVGVFAGEAAPGSCQEDEIVKNLVELLSHWNTETQVSIHLKLWNPLHVLSPRADPTGAILAHRFLIPGQEFSRKNCRFARILVTTKKSDVGSGQA